MTSRTQTQEQTQILHFENKNCPEPSKKIEKFN